MLFVTALVHGILYLSLIPPWQGGDEPLHFEAGRLLAEYGRPLRSGDGLPQIRQGILESLYQFRAGDFLRFSAQPPTFAQYEHTFFYGPDYVLTRFSLAYPPYAVAVWPFRDHGIATQLYIMRLVSVLWGAGVVVIAYETARLVAPRSPGFALGTAGFVLFLPQHAHLTASVSDGNLAELTASLTIYFLLKMTLSGFRWREGMLAIALMFVSIWTKSTALFLMPLVAVVELSAARRPQESGLQRRARWQGLLAFLVLAALGTVWLGSFQAYFIRQQIGIALSQLSDPCQYLSALNSQGRFSLALWALFRSFWVNLGWLAAPLPEAWYYVLFAFAVCALVGWSFRVRRQPWWNAKPALHTFIGLAACLPIAVTLLWFVVSPDGIRYQQGRYLFAGIVPIAMVLVGGVYAWGRGQVLPILVMLAMIGLDMATLLTLAIPFFYT
jgi:hypothetical protein